MIRTRRGRTTTAVVAATVLLAVPASSGAASDGVVSDGVVSAGGISAGRAGPAGDRPIDCRGWLRPNPRSVKNAKPVYSLTSRKWGDEVDVALWRGDAGPRGEWHYWAVLTGRTRRSDAVWLDVWPPGGGPWHRCGPFAVDHDGQAVSSPLAPWRDFTLVKACGRHDDFAACGRDKGAMVD